MSKKPINFYVWLRSGLRKLSRRWPAVYEALAAAKVPYQGENKRRQWSYKCAECAQLFDSKSVAVDHKIPAGQLACKEDVAGFVERLFCDASGLQVLCHDCHDLKTHMEKTGLSLEDAKIDKEVIRLLRKENKAEMIALLQQHGVECKNADQRREALTRILKEKM
jgi:5-methylcytosine-specific restriction endonuclease McrA